MPVIDCQGLSKYYPATLGRRRVDALYDLSMQVEEREVFGFLGPNGAGKTTTMKILTGLILPSTGKATIFGQPVADPRAKQRLGFLPEQPYFYDQLTGTELLDYFGRLFGIAGPERARRSKRLLERVGLAESADLPLRGYSKGMLQRVGIAQALINDPPLVILDEPMSGLDPMGRKEVRDIIFELRSEKRTVFFSTHILSDVEAVCDRIVILNKGRVVTMGPLADLLEMAGSTMEFVLGGASPAAIAALSQISGARLTQTGDRLLARIPQDHAGQALDAARTHQAQVLSMTPSRGSLEEVFMARVAETTEAARPRGTPRASSESEGQKR